MTKSDLIPAFCQQIPASTEFLVINALKLNNSIPPCQTCTRRVALEVRSTQISSLLSTPILYGIWGCIDNAANSASCRGPDTIRGGTYPSRFGTFRYKSQMNAIGEGSDLPCRGARSRTWWAALRRGRDVSCHDRADHSRLHPRRLLTPIAPIAASYRLQGPSTGRSSGSGQNVPPTGGYVHSVHAASRMRRNAGSRSSEGRGYR